MKESLTDRLHQAPVVPLIQADEPGLAIASAKALHAGGLGVIEVVLRSDQALACLGAVIEAIPEAIVGAGTVLTAGQASSVIDAGAAFIVSPGLDEAVVRVAQNAGLPVFPGIATATELQHAWNLGLDVVKFFPAGLAGGTAMLKALGAVFRGVRFMPTGGVAAANLADYLAVPSVIACGGSWLTPADEVRAGNFEAVTRLAQEALAIAASVRKT
jgi:2-dehydro-3-deoxyphosphogluconate aldolase/(4S)-4-hydroxy-2-oxoglutarate aldolase